MLLAKKSLLERLNEFDKKSKILKRFNPFESSRSFGCTPRLCVNVYTGCFFNCIYCYSRSYIPNFDKPRCKQNYEANLKRDIERALELGLGNLLVSVSNSCDPFQPLERVYKHTLYAIKRLIENGFRLILLTKNPAQLLEKQYLSALDPKNAIIEVTIPFLDNVGFFEPCAPSSQERIDAVCNLVNAGFIVSARIDPVIPRFGEVLGQSSDEIAALVEKLSQVGVKHVVAKCLRLTGVTARANPVFYHALVPFYKANGYWAGNCYVIRDEVKKELLSPVYQACERYGLKLSTCTDHVQFLNSRFCDQSEAKLAGKW